MAEEIAAHLLDASRGDVADGIAVAILGRQTPENPVY